MCNTPSSVDAQAQIRLNQAREARVPLVKMGWLVFLTTTTGGIARLTDVFACLSSTQVLDFGKGKVSATMSVTNAGA